MRYELRQRNEDYKRGYVVRATSDDQEALQAHYKRLWSSTKSPQALYIVDTLDIDNA